MTTTTPRPTEWAEDTSNYNRETVRHLAAQAFAQHVCVTVGLQEWHCYRPGTGIYSFRVIVRPGCVILWGDIGHAILRGGEAGNTVGWLRSAVHSEGYLLSKLKHRERTFYPGDVLAAVRLRMEEADSASLEGGPWRRVLGEALRFYRHGELDSRTWADLAYEHLSDPEYCDWGNGVTGEQLWVIEALKWLVVQPQVEEIARGGAGC